MKPQYIKSGPIPGGPDIIPGSEGSGGGVIAVLLAGDDDDVFSRTFEFSICGSTLSAAVAINPQYKFDAPCH